MTPAHGSGNEPTDFVAIDRRERKLTRIALVQFVVIVVIVVAFSALALRTNTGVQLLEERTPIIEAIRENSEQIAENERQVKCQGALNTRLFVSLSRLVGVPIESRAETIRRLSEAGVLVDAALRDGQDPCDISLPEIFPPSGPPSVSSPTEPGP